MERILDRVAQGWVDLSFTVGRWVATRKPMLRQRSIYVERWLAERPHIPAAHRRNFKSAMWRVTESSVSSQYAQLFANTFAWVLPATILIPFAAILAYLVLA